MNERFGEIKAIFDNRSSSKDSGKDNANINGDSPMGALQYGANTAKGVQFGVFD